MFGMILNTHCQFSRINVTQNVTNDNQGEQIVSHYKKKVELHPMSRPSQYIYKKVYIVSK